MSKANELLMMFIKDSYKSPSGKPSKKTAIAMMNFVADYPDLQQLISAGDHDEILRFKINKRWIRMRNKTLKILFAYLILFPFIGVSLEWLGLESVAYFAFYGAVFALITDTVVNYKK